MTILENNKLIAEFMGYNIDRIVEELPLDKNGDYTTENNKWININSLQYNTSWDWLMPVVEKIVSLEIEYPSALGFMRENVKDNLTQGIGVAFHTVVEFIKWYNENNS